MRLFLLQHLDDDTWHDCVREDLERDDVPAVFHTVTEALAARDTLCGLMHTGGDPRLFRVIGVEYVDGVVTFVTDCVVAV
jgi:hypothetical protein